MAMAVDGAVAVPVEGETTEADAAVRRRSGGRCSGEEEERR